MKAKKEKLFDIVVFKLETRVICWVAGFRMFRGTDVFNVAERLAEVLPRLNDSYSAAIVPSGKFRKGDVMPKRYK